MPTVENEYSYELNKWMLVCLTDENEIYRGKSTLLRMKITFEEEEHGPSTISGCRLYGLTLDGVDFDKVIVGFKTFALVALVGKYMLIYPRIGLVDIPPPEGSYFVSSTTGDGNHAHYHVIQMEKDAGKE